MRFNSILLLLTSTMLTVLSAWNLSTFIRLNTASNEYKDDQNFEDSCHISKTYTQGGLGLAIGMFLISILVLGVSYVNIYNY